MLHELFDVDNMNMLNHIIIDHKQINIRPANPIGRNRDHHIYYYRTPRRFPVRDCLKFAKFIITTKTRLIRNMFRTNMLK